MIHKIDSKTAKQITDILRQCEATEVVRDDLTDKIRNLDTKRPCLIAISGESGSGKSTLMAQIKKFLPQATYLTTDNYFKDFSQEIQLHGSFDALLAAGYNMQAPFSIHLDILRQNLTDLKQGKDVFIPEHLLNETGVTVLNKIPVKASDVVFVDGFCTLYEGVRDLFDFSVYLRADDKWHQEMFIKMQNERNIPTDQATRIFKILSVSSEIYIKPTMQYADCVLNVYHKDTESTIYQIIRLLMPKTPEELLLQKLKNPVGDLAVLWSAISDKTKQKILDELNKNCG